MYFLSCFVKAALFSHSGLSTKITWEGQELSWSSGFSEIQDKLKYIPLSCPCPSCVPNPSFHGVHKSRKTHYWSHTRTHVGSAVISSDASHNLNMNFSFISGPLKGKVAFHVAFLMCGDTVEFTWKDDQGYFAMDLSIPIPSTERFF